MTNAPQEPKKTSTLKVVLLILGALVLLCLISAVGKGAALGLLGLGGYVALFVKLPKYRKVGLVGLLLLAVLGVGIERAEQRSAAKLAAEAAAQRKAADDKATLDKAVAALSPDLSGDALVTACMDAAKAGGIPAAQAARCGDALLVAGQTALGAKRPADAIPLLEAATKTGSKKDEAQSALNEAKVARAASGAKEALAKAEEARVQKKYDSAVSLAQAALAKVSEGQQANPDHAELKVLAAKAGALVERAKSEAVKAERASREYLKLGPDDFVRAVGSAPIAAEYLETKAIGRWVRWSAKYDMGTDDLASFYAGSMVEMLCDFRSDSSGMKRPPLKRWQAVVVEGRIAEPPPGLPPSDDPNRLKVVFDNCSW